MAIILFMEALANFEIALALSISKLPLLTFFISISKSFPNSDSLSIVITYSDPKI